MQQTLKLTTQYLLPIVLVNIATLSWAGNMVIGRWMSEHIGPLSLSASRYMISCIVFGVMLGFQAPDNRKPGKDFWWLISMALTGAVGFPCLLYFGLRYTTAINATLINGLGPFLTALFASILINEPMTRTQKIGTVIVFLGVVLLISADWARHEHYGLNPGDLLVLGAVAMWSLFSVFSRRVTKGRSVISASAFASILGFPILLSLGVLEYSYSPFHLTREVLLGILYIGIFPSVISLIFWNYGVSKLGSTGAMVFYNTLPFYGVILSFLFLKEPLYMFHIIGGFMIVGGALFSNREARAIETQTAIVPRSQ